MKGVFLSIVVFFGLSYAGAGLFLYAMQRQFMYSPTVEPKNLDISSEFIASEKEQIKVLKLNEGNPNAIVYFGGNAENVSGNIEWFESSFSDFAVYLINYRGYSGSSGSPSEQGNYVDALKIYDQIKSRHDSVSVIGRSLGSGVASYLAAKRKIDNLVLVTPFDSIEQIAKLQYPIFPISKMLKDKYDSYSRAHLVDAKTLVIVAERDEIIPRKNTERLLERLNEKNTQVAVIRDATHNSIDVNGEYARLLTEFFYN